MADAHFRRRIRLAKRAAERFIVKQRIVSEPVRSARLMSDAAFHFASKCSDKLAIAYQCDHANESRRAIFDAAQLLEEPLVIKVGGIDSRPSAERIHFNP